ncbi:MAG TPA: hypothetical protein VHE61_11850 [Opitutaceae bacterium]|nr:hypothetical protein [Opitutaceae bacterium]
MATALTTRSITTLAALALAVSLPAEPTPTVTADSSVPVAPALASPTDAGDSNWSFATRVTTTATYDDNVFIQPHGARSDVYFHLAPSLVAGIGAFRTAIAPFASIPHLLAMTGEEDLPRKDYAFLSYTPDVVIFSKYHHEDTVNHDVRLAARKERELWSAAGEFHFQRLNDIDIDVGQRLRQTYYTADANAWHALSGRTNATLGFLGLRSEYSGGFASTDLRGSAGLEYQIAPKTSVGVGATLGHLDVRHGGGQTYEQPLLQLQYNPTGKLSFDGRFGEEFRHYNSDIPRRSRFVYALSGNYTPSDDTVVAITGQRDTTTSAEYVGENVVSDTFQGSIRQRVLTRTYLTLAGGYVRDRYEENRVVTPLDRRDDYAFGRLSASRDVTTHGTVELSYEHRKNDSTFSAFSFSQNIAAVSASFLF